METAPDFVIGGKMHDFKLASPEFMTPLGQKSRKSCRLSNAERLERREKILEKRETTRIKGMGYIIRHERSPFGNRRRAKGGGFKFRIDPKVIQARMIHSNTPPIRVEGNEVLTLLSRTPTTAKAIEAAYTAVMKIKKA